MPGTSDYDVLYRLAAQRRSVRRFKPDRVERHLIEQVLDVARLAPSAANSQPWEFVVVEGAERRSLIARAAAAMFPEGRKHDPSFNWSVSVQPFIGQAPVIIVVLGDRRVMEAYPSILRGNVLLRQSLAICVYGLQLAAHSLGLATAWGTLQGGAPEAEIRASLEIPAHFAVDHLVPLGYPDEIEGARATALEPARRLAPRRRELESVVHWERYDVSRARGDEATQEFIRSETVTRWRQQPG